MKTNIIARPFVWIWKSMKWYGRLYKGRHWAVKSIVALLSIIFAIIIYFGMVDINFLWLFGKSPGIAAIQNPPTNEASIIYSADGKQIGKFYNENRTPVAYKDVNPIFWKALISTEDARFYNHHGIDPIGMFGALKDAIVNDDARGASTITQQLAKNMFRVRTQYSTGLIGKIPGIKILVMKSKEWIIALKLEMIYSKEEILTMYANTVDFGSNAYGIKTAAKTYFNTTPDQLTADQSALLVGMLKATTTYNPISNPENALARRNTVLYNMQKEGFLTNEDYTNFSKKPLSLDITHESHYDGEANYFREALRRHLQPWCEENGYDLLSSGLKIYTTIDSRLQYYAEKAAAKQMNEIQKRFNTHWGGQEPWRDERGRIIPNFIEGIAKKLPVYNHLSEKYKGNTDSINYYLNKPHRVKLFDYEQGQIEREMSTMDSIRYMVRFMHCGMVAMEPHTGYIKAWVGDVDFDSWKYDKVLAMRQPGSTFKLFVYTEAYNQGYSPCTKRRDEFISMEVFDHKKKELVTWAPHNSDGRFTGDSVPLKSAFAKSINSIAVKLGQEAGIKNIAKTAKDMGIDSPLEEEPSLSLGSSDVNLLELTNAYATIANNGKRRVPVFVSRIVDKDGNEVYIAPTVEHQAVPLRTAYLMQQTLLTGIREGFGTSQPIWSYVGNFRDTDFGGKTGTSNNHSDAWFVAVSPRLVVGTWVGGEYRSIHFRTGALGQGSRTALPLCGTFLQSVLADPNFSHYHAKFATPPTDVVSPSEYNCSPASTRGQTYELDDSLFFIDDSRYLDENGNIRQELLMPESSNHNKEHSGNSTPQEQSLGIEDF